MKKLIILAPALWAACVFAQVNVQGTNIQIGGTSPVASLPATTNVLSGNGSGGASDTGIAPNSVCLADGTHCPAGGGNLPATTNLIKGDGSGNGADSGLAPAAVVTLTGAQTLTNKTIDGVTPTVMGYVDPISSIQGQLNGKQATMTASAVASLIQTQSGCNTAGYVWQPQSNTCVAQTGGGGGSVICPANASGIICITNAPYSAYALSSAMLTAGLTSGSTTATVDTCTPFIAAGTGIRIPGAGAAGAIYSGTVVSCTGNTLTFTPATSNSIPALYGLEQSGQTKTTATFAPGTSGTVASCATFSSGNGIYIAGAGSAGANYVGAVSSCSGTTLTVTPATSTSVASGTIVQHDETAAFQSAINAFGTSGGDIYVPGRFLVSGALQDTSGANAVLKMPTLDYQGVQPVVIRFKGVHIPSGAGGYDYHASTIDASAVTTGNIFAGYNAASGYAPLTNVWLVMEDMQLTASGNPGVKMLNGGNLAAMQLTHVAVNVGPINPPDPSNTAGAAIIEPLILNNIQNLITDVTVVGYYTGYQVTEHTSVRSANAVSVFNGFLLDNGSNALAPGTYSGNSLSMDNVLCLLCHRSFSAGANNTVVDIRNAKSELASEYAIYDPSSTLKGIVDIMNPYTPNTVTVNGGANLAITNLNDPLTVTIASGNMIRKFIGPDQYGAEVWYGNATSHTWAQNVLGGGYATNGTSGNICMQDKTANYFAYCVSSAYVKLNATEFFGFSNGTPEGFGSGVDIGLSRKSAGNFSVDGSTKGDGQGSINGKNFVGVGYGAFTGLAQNIITATSSLTLTLNNFAVLCDASGAARTISMPAVPANFIYIIKKADTSTNTCTVSGNGHNIDGASSVVLTAPNQWLVIEGDATAWWITGRGGLGYEVLAYNENLTFSPEVDISQVVLTGDVASWTLAAPANANAPKNKCIVWAQDSAGGHVVSATPSNVHGFFTPGTAASKSSQQCYNWVPFGSVWLAESSGQTNM